jgi:hypothetical protein
MMAKGKHALRAEVRTFENLNLEIAKLKTNLSTGKASLSKARREVLRLTAIEAVFDQTKDLIAEVDGLKRELADVQGKNFVLNVRLTRWAEVLIA